MCKKKLLLLCLVVSGSITCLFAQDAGKQDIATDSIANTSVKRELALFSFSQGNFKIPRELTEKVDLDIRKTFISASRFVIRSVPFTLAKGEVEQFARFIGKQNRGEAGIEIPEYTAGRLTDEQLSEIRHTEIAVIPVLEKYTEEIDKREDQERYKISLQTDFYFIFQNDGRIFSVKKINTLGYDKNRETALNDALLNISPLLAYEIGQINELSTGMIILGVSGDEVIIELGAKAGVAVGDEFVIQVSEVQSNGLVQMHDKVLIAITEVTDEVALGIVRYTNGNITIGDTVQNLGRIGLQLSAYGYGCISLLNNNELSAYAGFRLALSKYVSMLRPFIAVEFLGYPFSEYTSWFPVRAFVGAEIRLLFGPFEAAALPAIGVEERIAMSSANNSEFGGVGFRSAVEFSLLISREVKIFVNGGYDYWIGGQQCILAGGGLTIKF